MTSGGVVFLGASALGARCCEALLDLGLPVTKVLTIPREFTISWSKTSVVNAQFADLADLAAARSIPVDYLRGGRAEDYRAGLGSHTPDLLVVAGWYYLIPDVIRRAARLGAIGVHASLLPRNRGGAPLVWAMINGEREAGVTVFHLASGVDDGDIVAQARFEITDADDIRSLIERATDRSAALLRDEVPRVLAGTAPRIPQDHQAATVLPQRSPADGLIDWETLTARRAFDWIRAQTRPYPGAFTFLGYERVTIWAARPTERTGTVLPPGTLEPGGRLAVWCAQGTVLEILEASLGDGDRLTAKDLIAGANIQAAARFSSEPARR